MDSALSGFTRCNRQSNDGLNNKKKEQSVTTKKDCGTSINK